MTRPTSLLLAIFLIAATPFVSLSQSLSVNTDGSAAHASAMLDVKSTTKGLLIPRMSRTERDAIASPATGLLIFQNAPDSIGYYYFNGTAWTWLLANSNADSLAWRTGGNTGTLPANNFIGTRDNVDLVVKTNNTEAIRVATNGAIGLGTNLPSTGPGISSRLDIRDEDGNLSDITQVVAGTSGAAFHNFVKQRGTLAAPLPALPNDLLGAIAGNLYDGAFHSSSTRIEMRADGTISPTQRPGAISFWTRDTSSGVGLSQRLTIKASGKVGIGTTTPTVTLDVNGSATIGANNINTGIKTIASGNANNLSGNYSIVTGENNTVSSIRSMVSGVTNNVSGENNIVSGVLNQVVSPYGHSIVVGYQDTLNGSASAIFGFKNNVTGFTGFAAGDRNTVFAQNGAAFGYQNATSGTSAFVTGLLDTAAGNNSAAFGLGNKAASFNEFTLGMYGTRYTPASISVYDPTDRIFNVGNGISSVLRADAFTILKGGNVGIGIATPVARLDIAGNNAGTNAVLLRSGNTSFGTSSNQLTFGYDGTAQYRHSIKTRHNSGSDIGNAFDFYLWNQGVDNIDTLGSEAAMTLDGNHRGMLGIGTKTPRSEVHISDGSTSLKTVNDGIGYGASMLITDNNLPRIYLEGAGEPVDKKLMDIAMSLQSIRFGALDDAGSVHLKADILVVNRDGNVGIGASNPTALLDVNSNTLRLRTPKTPASATDTGNTGDIAWDTDYIYVCVAANTWKRVAIATW